MPEVWQYTVEEFLGPFPVEEPEGEDFEEVERIYGAEVQDGTEAWIPRSIRPVPGHPDLFFADVRRQPEDVALLQEDRETGDLTVVGGYVGEFLWVDGGPNHRRGLRGRHLASELVLAKAEKVEGPIEAVSYTAGGYKATAWAHFLAVERALANGNRVSDKVLAGHPCLADPGSSPRGPRFEARMSSRAEAIGMIHGRHAGGGPSASP